MYLRWDRVRSGGIAHLCGPRVSGRERVTAAKAVIQWRDRLRRELGIAALDWNEDPETDYATDKPAWDCYGALVLWAAYDELPNAKRRQTAEGWNEDPAYVTSRMNSRSRYRHLIADTEIWLPVEFGNPVQTAATASRWVEYPAAG